MVYQSAWILLSCNFWTYATTLLDALPDILVYRFWNRYPSHTLPEAKGRAKMDSPGNLPKSSLVD